MVTEQTKLNHSVVISCVDTRLGRRQVLKSAMEQGSKWAVYWLDFGNGRDFGQAVLGQVRRGSIRRNECRLPHLGDLLLRSWTLPWLILTKGPHVSLAEALERQSLFINRAGSCLV